MRRMEAGVGFVQSGTSWLAVVIGRSNQREAGSRIGLGLGLGPGLGLGLGLGNCGLGVGDWGLLPLERKCPGRAHFLGSGEGMRKESLLLFLLFSFVSYAFPSRSSCSGFLCLRAVCAVPCSGFWMGCGAAV